MGDGLAEGDLEFPEERHWNSEDESVGSGESEGFIELGGLTHRTLRTVVTRKFCILKEHFSVRAINIRSQYPLSTTHLQDQAQPCNNVSLIR